MSKAPPCVAVIGARKTGKTHWVKQSLARAKPPRLLVWDPVGGVEFGYDAVGTVFHDEVKLIEHVGALSTFAAVFHPGMNVVDRKTKVSTYETKFSRLCRLARRLGDVTLVVDELADVTSPGWAPDDWQEITRKGGNYGIAVYGVTQRPAEIDGTFLGNTTFIHCRRCNDESSIKKMSGFLRVAPAEVAALTGYEFFERNMETGAVRRVPAKPTYVRT